MVTHWLLVYGFATIQIIKCYPSFLVIKFLMIIKSLIIKFLMTKSLMIKSLMTKSLMTNSLMWNTKMLKMLKTTKSSKCDSILCCFRIKFCIIQWYQVSLIVSDTKVLLNCQQRQWMCCAIGIPSVTQCWGCVGKDFLLWWLHVYQYSLHYHMDFGGTGPHSTQKHNMP